MRGRIVFSNVGAWPTYGGSSWLGGSPCMMQHPQAAVSTLPGQPSGRLGNTSGSKRLRFEKYSSHSRCIQCFQYREALTKGTGDASSKQEVGNNWREHLQKQYHDRQLYWHLRWFARQYRSQCSAPSHTSRSVLSIIIDSMDTRRLVWPQYFFRKTEVVGSLVAPSHGVRTRLGPWLDL